MNMVLDMADLDTIAEMAFAPVEEAIDAGRIPGAVFGLVTADGARTLRHAGRAQIIPQARSMTEATWFDLASLTKVMFTTPRILAHADAGRIDLDAPVASVVRDFRQYAPDCWERQATFRQCLGHQTPFPAVEPLYTYGQDPATLRAFVLQREWRGGLPVYSDINYILLGIALERLEGRTIRDFPLTDGLSFAPDPAETAATEACAWRGRVMVGEVHDENCFALRGSGHAGLFGTPTGVLDFAQGLLNRQGASAHAIRLMRTPLSSKRTHGWEHPYLDWSGGSSCSAATIGHTGFTGTGLWIDFEAGLAWTLLTNRVHPSRHFDSGIFALRQKVGTIVGEARARQ
jgi:CubicO group peptidase (beta-lactamase class C family)